MGTLDNPTSLAGLDAEITRQAMMIRYLDVFQTTTWTAALTVPLVLLLSRGR